MPTRFAFTFARKGVTNSLINTLTTMLTVGSKPIVRACYLRELKKNYNKTRNTLPYRRQKKRGVGGRREKTYFDCKWDHHSSLHIDICWAQHIFHECKDQYTQQCSGCHFECIPHNILQLVWSLLMSASKIVFKKRDQEIIKNFRRSLNMDHT